MNDNLNFFLDSDEENTNSSAISSSSNNSSLFLTDDNLTDRINSSFSRELPIELISENSEIAIDEPNDSSVLVFPTQERLESKIDSQNNLSFNSLASDSLNRVIANGDFSLSDSTAKDFGWNLTGKAYVETERGVIEESSAFASSISQSFTIPADAKSLKLTLVDSDLSDNLFAPPDTLEIALLDANTLTSLVGTHELGDTDAFFNLQNDGTVSFSDRVRMGGKTSGDTINLDNSHIVSVDISHLSPETEATLYFDLLGFGAIDSQILIDDVIISENSLATPIAVDDTITIDQGEIATINVLANDSDSDGTIIPASLQISTQPTNGTAIPLPDGRVSYLPSSGFAGLDSFTYIVRDNDGQFSNPATVNITVNNIAPSIENIQLPNTIIEGTEIEIKAIALDLGNDELTYSWIIDGQTINTSQSTIERIFIDNGIYNTTLTVSDPYGGSETQTIDLRVDNAAPTVDAGGNRTIEEGENVILSGTYSDLGINDTHTARWEFDDGTIIEGQTAERTYSESGIYIATFTVTDNDGASSSEIINITVNNTAPEITFLTGDTSINEGETATFNASATDPSNGELTYSWDFGDGTPQLSVSESELPVSHEYLDNGNYTVTLTVTDNDGESVAQTLDIAVDNVAPTISSIDGLTAVLEGETVTYSATAFDPGNDELTYNWSVNGNSTDNESNSSIIDYTFDDNGTYNISLTVTDSDGAFTTSNLEIAVNNVAPTIDIASEIMGNEGDTISFNPTLSDPGNDSLTVTFDFGDGSSDLSVSESELPVTHTYANNGNYTTTITVSDEDGGLTSQNIDVIIRNTAPVITSLTGDTEIDEGNEAQFNASATDRGNGNLSYTWDFGDGSSGLSVSESELPVTHEYSDNGNYTVTLTVTDEEGESASSTLDLIVSNVAPVITEIFGSTEVNEGEEVSYSAVASDSGDDTLTYSWDFGNGSEASGEDVTHTFTDNGDYTITLIVTDDDGASTTQTLDVVVNNLAPTITEIIGNTEVNEGESVAYSAIASDPGDDTLTYSWDFGDGTTIEGESVTHTFADNGNYTITLTVTDDDGAVTTSTLDVTVNNVAPVIDEIIGDTEISEGESVAYSAIASDPGDDTLTYSWDFGDGSEAEGENVTHTFTDNGNYTITLTVTDDDGAATTSTLDVAVNNVAPIITEIVGDTEVNEGESVAYSAIASDSGDDTLTYSWSFSDGSEIVEGENVNHIFADNGNYTITLSVTDDDGASTTQTLDVVVNNLAPTITEIVGDTEVNEGESVAYSAIASDPGDDTLTYSWDFGDGSTAEGESANHTFADNGNYTITLTVTDDDGASTISTLDVIVNNLAPVITEIIGDTEINEGEEVTYSAVASDPGNDTLTYSWEFGDGTSAEGQDVTHTFADNGNYTVTLTVTDNDGAATTSTLDVVVNNVAPIITEITGDTEINEGEEVTYSAIASDLGNDTLTYSWEFGDGTSAEGQDVTHTFADDGNYTITLTVTDDDGATAIRTLDVVVNNLAPTITEIIGESEVNEGEEVTYSAIASDPGDDTLTFNWDFGDGSEASGEDVNHTFTDNGDYTITLTVTDDDGASTISTLDVIVNNLAPVITEIIGDTEINEGEEVTYSAIASDPGNDTLTYSWNFGDSREAEGQDVNHTFADNGNYTITLTVSDDDGAATTSTLDVTVNNLAPVITEIIGNTNINEGEEVSYSTSATDPGDDTLTYNWNFGDGSEPIEGESVTHTFADNGNYTITLTVMDDDGTSTIQTLDVVVNNLAPTISNFTGDSELDEGDLGNFSVTATDVEEDTLTYAWDFGDGTGTVFGENIEHLFVDNGLYNVKVTVTDDDGASTTQSLTVSVNNVTPTIDPWSNKTSNEGEVVEFLATFRDPGKLDNHTIEWNFGDGSEVITESIDSSELTTYDLTQTHIYNDDGIYTASLKITDNDGAVVTNTMTVTVNNSAPTIDSLTGDTNIDEGDLASYSVSASDAGNDTLTYSWDFGDGTTTEGKDVTHTFADNGEYTVTLTVNDDDGASTTSSLEVTVNNVAPTITDVSYGEIAEGISTQFTATATDPGDDTLIYSWNFGDGSEPVTGETVNHLFVDNGEYTITLTVKDEDGGITTENRSIITTEVFNIKAEGRVRINGSSDLDGEPLNLDDDTRIYAGEGFILNGNQTLPVLRDESGNPIKVNGKSVLIDRAVTVGPNYTQSKASASKKKYANLIPPQVVNELTVNVPVHSELVSSQLASMISEGTAEVIFNPQQNPINNVSDWQNYFPAPGTINEPRVVRIANGSLNVPNNVDLSNYVIILENGGISFNGSGNTINNTALIAENGSINLASVEANNLSVLASGSINMNNRARFAGDTLIATGDNNGHIHFNGATVNSEPSYLKVISQGDITFNSSNTVIGEFIARKDFSSNGSSSITGSIRAKGNITINGSSIITNLS